MTSKESQVLFLGNMSSFEKEIKPKLFGVSDIFSKSTNLIKSTNHSKCTDDKKSTNRNQRKKMYYEYMNRTKITICVESTNRTKSTNRGQLQSFWSRT